MICPSAKWSPCRVKCPARSYGDLVIRDPVIRDPAMKENPASSTAFRLPANSIPAPATTAIPITPCLSRKARRTGSKVLPAVLPANR